MGNLLKNKTHTGQSENAAQSLSRMLLIMFQVCGTNPQHSSPQREHTGQHCQANSLEEERDVSETDFLKRHFILNPKGTV